MKNPVLVAKKVAESPHRLIAGEGATQFARRYGFPYFDPSSPKNVERLGRYKKKLLDDDLPEWLGNWKAYRDMCKDTVGAIAVDRRNVFAAASSSGGTSIMLPGRVGDCALIGCGQYVGKEGGVLSTGVGEAIMEKILSYTIYQKIIEGMPAKAAADWGVAQYPKDIPMGVMTISKLGWGVSANMHMACTVMTWDTTLNGNDIWPSEEADALVTEVRIPAEATQEVAVTTEAPAAVQEVAGRAEAARAVQELIAPEAKPQPQAPPPAQPPKPKVAPPPVVATSPAIQPPPVTMPPPAPAPAPTPAQVPPKPTVPKEVVSTEPRKFKCPYCTRVFAIAIMSTPVTVNCPYCQKLTIIQ